jgi:uncharacterized protein YggE
MIKRISISIISLSLLFFGNSGADAMERYISVSATGTVKVKPDTVRINASTWSIGSNNKIALTQTSAASEKLRATLATFGISKNYIKSFAIAVYPEYNYTADKGSALTGYRATQSFEVIVKNASSAGSLVDSLVEKVGDSLTIEGVTPFISDPTSATASARVDAVNRARAKAQSYAKLLNVSLGKIINLTENNSSSATPLLSAMAKSDSGATTVDLGTQDVVVSIQTKWLIN